MGRFISKDGEQYHEGNTGAAANLYAYANNNPVMNVDPDGHIWISKSDIIGLLSGLILQYLPLFLVPGMREVSLIKLGVILFCVGIQLAITILSYNNTIRKDRTPAVINMARSFLVLGIVSATISGACGFLGYIVVRKEIE